jgi:hypothetical protein
VSKQESKQDKVKYVLGQKQTRNHHCHWPGCTAQVPPAVWGCKKHWFKLPRNLREKIWGAYRIGQEVNLTPSREYVKVAIEVQEWIHAYLRSQEAPNDGTLPLLD